MDSRQPDPALCAQCLTLDFEYLETHPRSARVIRASREADCACCRFLWNSLDPLETTTGAELAQGTVRNVLVRNAGQSGGPMRERNLIISTANARWKYTISVLLRLGPSINARPDTSMFQPIHPASIDYDLLKSWIRNCQEDHTDTCLRQYRRSDASSDDIPGFKLIRGLELCMGKGTMWFRA
jgi:hypothetical protein